MRMLRAIATLFILATSTTAVAALTSSVHDSRRTFLQRTIAATVTIGGVATSGGPFSAANAAYTREVGGPEKSAEQAAYNLQVR